MFFTVEAAVIDEAGHSDAAYDLCGTFTAEELLSELAERLKTPLNQQLMNATGNVRLEITIR